MYMYIHMCVCLFQIYDTTVCVACERCGKNYQLPFWIEAGPKYFTGSPWPRNATNIERSTLSLNLDMISYDSYFANRTWIQIVFVCPCVRSLHTHINHIYYSIYKNIGVYI